jgi:hypothetical protein
MMRPTFIFALVTVAAVIASPAEDFPLTFRTIPAQDVMSFPGNFGSVGQLRLVKPTGLKREPKAISRHPLYGECSDSPAGGVFIFRLDESRGEGTGYDRLLVDINRNGELTDDAVVQRAVIPSNRRESYPNQLLFGPILASPNKLIAGESMVYFAQVYMFRYPSLSSGRIDQSTPSGQLMLRTGWYLDTTVRLNGVNHKVGVLDGNGNLRLGDESRVQTVANRAEKTWYFRPGDCWLIDADGSGRFEHNVFRSEERPFGPILYLGSKAYKVALTPDGKALRVEPWPEPLAVLALQPRGDQVHDITLAWERSRGLWQLIRPTVAGGKVMAPPGNYRLYACNLLGKGPPGAHVMVSGTQRNLQPPVSVAVGKANTLVCGAPLEIKVTVAKAAAAPRGLSFWNSGNAAAVGDAVVDINASVAGAGGEVYSTFLAGDGFRSKPPKPTFSVVQAGGKTVATGNLEYG